ncbi:MAG: hypothetical protein K6D02_05225 [Lachnospiraceae bacterium]|nr:hypothetical protein [Lachnospiraceae bacterium]
MTNTNRKTEINNIVSRILKSKDKDWITEIYATKASIKDGNVQDDVVISVCCDPNFKNTDLFEVFSNIERDNHSFSLFIFAEPDMMDREYGIVLWKR